MTAHVSRVRLFRERRDAPNALPNLLSLGGKRLVSDLV